MGEHWQRDSGHWDDSSLLLSGLSGTLSRIRSHHELHIMSLLLSYQLSEVGVLSKSPNLGGWQQRVSMYHLQSCKVVIVLM